MKKNGLLKIAAVVFAITILTTCLISGTFAKYTSETTGNATSTVATWSVSVGEDATGTANAGTVTLKDLGVLKPGDVAYITLHLDNKSNIAANATISTTANWADTDSTAAALANPFTVTIVEETSLTEISTPIALAKDNGSKIVRVAITWTSQNDTKDTEYGIAALAGRLTYSLDVSVVFTQA